MINTSRSFNLKITPLSDIHVGTGNDIMPYDYVIKGGYFYQVDSLNIFRSLSESQKREFSIYAEQDIIKLREFVSRVYDEKMGYDLKLRASDEFRALYNSKISGARNSNEENQLQIKAMPGNEKGIYIPGSTVKGAMRGALVEYLASGYGKNTLGYSLERKENKTKTPVFKGSNRDISNFEKQIIQNAFGCDENETINPRNDPFRNIKISDSTSTGDAAVKKLKMYSYSSKMDNFANSVPSYAQVIEKSEDMKKGVVNCNFKIEKGFREKTVADIKFQDILYALDAKYVKMMDKDIEYYENILSKTRKNRDVIEEVLWNIDRIEEVYKDRTETQAIIRFGYGAGFNSTTFNLSSGSPLFIASRILSEDIRPMGYALLDFEEIM